MMLRRSLFASGLVCFILAIAINCDSEAIGSPGKGQGKSGGQNKPKKLQQSKAKSVNQTNQQSNTNLEQIFNQADTNKNGSLTREEFLAAIALHHGGKVAGSGEKAAPQAKAGDQGKGNADLPHPFKDADTNGDEKLSFQEFSAFIQAKSAQRQQKGADGKK